VTYRGRNVATASCPVDVDVLALLVLLVGAFWLDPERVRAEVVTLCLQQVGWEVLRAVSVVEAERGAESGSWDTPERALGNDADIGLAVSTTSTHRYLLSPSGLCGVDSLVEEVVEEQVLEVGVGPVCLGDVLEEDGSDDATTAPHESNLGLVQLPLVLLGSLSVD
jgi:hypothetical protein